MKMTKAYAESMSSWNLQQEINYRNKVKNTEAYKGWSRASKVAWTRSVTLMANVLADRLMVSIFGDTKAGA